MLRHIFIICICILCFSCNRYTKLSKGKEFNEIVDSALVLAEFQYKELAKLYFLKNNLLPRSFKDSSISSTSKWWTSGFFPGSLWYLYENNKDPEILEYAKKFTDRVYNEQYTTDNHDVGFMIFCSYGNGYRLTRDTNYIKVLMNAASSLATRFKSETGVIRSWDFNRDRWQYPVIIDNMMNLELLIWASQNGTDNRFSNIAFSHADKTIKHHFRNDFSSYHVVSYDTTTGLPHLKQTYQGMDSSSAWARGQGWGLYGYTMLYRMTGKLTYLEQAKNIADYILQHPGMNEDFIPNWDLNAPIGKTTYRDASAASLIASALIELSGFVKGHRKQQYLAIAMKQIRTLASTHYLAGKGQNGFFVLKHSVGSLPHNSEVDVPLTYADYYFIEALIRLKGLKK